MGSSALPKAKRAVWSTTPPPTPSAATVSHTSKEHALSVPYHTCQGRYSSSSARTARSSMAGVKGLGRNSPSGSSSPWWTTRSSAYPEV
jgi:hypothetical protein